MGVVRGHANPTRPSAATKVGRNAIPSGTDWQSVLRKCSPKNKTSGNSSTGPPARKRREEELSSLVAPVPRHCLRVSGPFRRPSTPRSGIGADQLARGADGGNAGTQAWFRRRFPETAPTTEYTDTGVRCRNGGFSACLRPTRALTQRTTADRTRRVVVRMIARLAGCSRAKLLSGCDLRAQARSVWAHRGGARRVLRTCVSMPRTR